MSNKITSKIKGWFKKKDIPQNNPAIQSGDVGNYWQAQQMAQMSAAAAIAHHQAQVQFMQQAQFIQQAYQSAHSTQQYYEMIEEDKLLRENEGLKELKQDIINAEAKYKMYLALLRQPPNIS